MKKSINSYMNSRNLAKFLILLLSVSFIFTSDAGAQSRHGYGGRGGGRGRGSFIHSPRVSFRFSPRIGARIRVLPFGYTSFWFGGIPYYFYDGIYYRYYPDDRYYEVVEKPAGVKNISDLKFDQVKMADGSMLEGVFQGATDSTITMKLGDKNHEINIGDIVSITFAPSVQDSTKQK